MAGGSVAMTCPWFVVRSDTAMSNNRTRLSTELIRPLGQLPDFERRVRGFVLLVVAIASEVLAVWKLGALVGSLIIACAVLAVGVGAEFVSIRRLVALVNGYEGAAEREPRLVLASVEVIPRGFGIEVHEYTSDGVQTREGMEAGSMVLVQVANRPAGERGGEPASNVSAEITVRDEAGEVWRTARGHWVDAGLGDWLRTITAGAATVPLDLIAKMTDDDSAFIYTERGLEDHYRIATQRLDVEIVVSGDNTAPVRQRFIVEHDGPGSTLRVFEASP
jgi:hypothetical protein